MRQRTVWLLPCLVASLALGPQAPHLAQHVGCRAASRICAGPLACAAPPPPEADPEAAEPPQPQPSLFPAWPELSPKADVLELLAVFAATAAAVPLGASSEPGEGWRRWRDDGFDTHKLMAARLSRQYYPEAAACLGSVLSQAQKSYPDLNASLKFVPKKNGLHPKP